MLGEISQITDVSTSSPSMTSSAQTLAPHVPAAERDEVKESRIGGLVLTRHLGESIVIGDEVEVEVVGLKSGTVRLKIVAPRSIAVHRREIFDAIKANFAPQVAAPVAERPTTKTSKTGGLVLARSARQSIMIGEDIEIGVVEVRPSTVKLRISAPRSISVHRREVFDSLRAGQV